MSKTFTHTIITEGQLKTLTEDIVDAVAPTSTTISTSISPFPFTMSIADATVHGKAGALVPLSVYLARNGVADAFTLKLGYGTSDANFFVTNTYNSFSASFIDATFMLATTEPDLTKKFLWFQATPESATYRAMSGPVLIAGGIIQGYITVDPAQIGQTAAPVVPTAAPTIPVATVPSLLNVTIIAPKVNNLFILVGNPTNPDLPIVFSGPNNNNTIGKTLSVQVLNQTVKLLVTDSSSRYQNLTETIVVSGNTDKTFTLIENYLNYVLVPNAVYTSPVTVNIYRDGVYNSSFTFTGSQPVSLALGNYTFNFSAAGYNNFTLNTNETQAPQINFGLVKTIVSGSFSVTPYILKVLSNTTLVSDGDGPTRTTIVSSFTDATFPVGIANNYDGTNTFLAEIFLRFSMDNLPVGAVINSLVLTANVASTNLLNPSVVTIGHTYINPAGDAATALAVPIDTAIGYNLYPGDLGGIKNFVLAIPPAVVPLSLLIAHQTGTFTLNSAVLNVSWIQQ